MDLSAWGSMITAGNLRKLKEFSKIMQFVLYLILIKEQHYNLIIKKTNIMKVENLIELFIQICE